eukprot:scaffold33779_cov50-Prasinocladus_malaysianus.AAC.6
MVNGFAFDAMRSQEISAGKEPPTQITEDALEAGEVDEDPALPWQRAVWELLEIFFVEKGSTRVGRMESTPPARTIVQLGLHYNVGCCKFIKQV